MNITNHSPIMHMKGNVIIAALVQQITWSIIIHKHNKCHWPHAISRNTAFLWMQVKQAHITGAIINNKNRVKLSITVGRLLGMSKLTDETTHGVCLYWYIFWMRATNSCCDRSYDALRKQQNKKAIQLSKQLQSLFMCSDI